jgi:hypothetical protein
MIACRSCPSIAIMRMANRKGQRRALAAPRRMTFCACGRSRSRSTGRGDDDPSLVADAEGYA